MYEELANGWCVSSNVLNHSELYYILSAKRNMHTCKSRKETKVALASIAPYISYAHCMHNISV